VTEPEECDERLTALEADVAALQSRLGRAEQDAAAARYLAGGADRDVGGLGREFRQFRDQNNRVLSAMRADLADIRTEMRTDFADVRAEMRQGFTEMRGLLGGQAAFSRQLADMLGVLIRQQGADRPEQ
jgi:gamma-glutamylcysteine synthetase